MSTPSSSSECIREIDNANFEDTKEITPSTLKSTENLLALSKKMDENDLKELIDKCKEMVLESTECSEERKWLVRRLIELRIRAQELREAVNEKTLETYVVLGHHFKPQKYYIATSGSVYCDHCSYSIWTMLQTWYLCNDCGYCCHMKCMSSIYRVCAHVVASEAGGYTHTKDICPEKGLSAQDYKCAECNSKIKFKSGWLEPRLCDYTGLYFCQRCHWNSFAIIPARIVRNWDMEPRRVSRAAYQLLNLLQNKPVLFLEVLNKSLFDLVPNLSLVKKLRKELQMMKQYLIVCPEASNIGLPWKLSLRSHMLEGSTNYSVKDLLDLQSGALMDEIECAYKIMQSHITKTCDLCKARGHLCELCGNNEIIYPWDKTAAMCQDCSTIYHQLCRTKKKNSCPKCVRVQQRQSTGVKDES